MIDHRWGTAGWLPGVCLIVGTACSNIDLGTVAPQARDALQAAFPSATYQGASSEDEDGVRCYEVKLTQDGRAGDGCARV